MKRILTVALALSVVLGCTPSGDEPNGLREGQSDFETLLYGGRGGGDDGADGEMGQPGAPADDEGAEAPAERLIEESDIYKREGDYLYVLNRYRGLQILDVSDLDRPKVVGRAPIFGWPREMYVRGDKAYVVVSDYYTFWRDGTDDAVAAGFHGSQVRVVNVADPARPKVVGAIDVQGDVTDSRLVGDILYLVSRRYSWWWNPSSDDHVSKTVVLSIDVSDPEDVRAVDSEDFPQDGWDTHLLVTSNTIYVATAGWRSGGYRTDIRYVDISDPAGDIRLRGKLQVPGLVPDRWAMDEHDGVLRVASGESWGNGDVHLTTWSVGEPDAITSLGRYTLRVNERLTAARFDGRHGYLVSYRNIDPLFTFDLSDPAKPLLLGELEMTGWLDFMVPMGDRIVALGHEDTDINGERRISLAVSLIDATPHQAPRLLSRVVVGSDWGWVPGTRDDFAKVFRVIADQGLVMLPFQSWDQNTWRYAGGVQLIDLDLENDRLVKRGLIGDAGWVERAIAENTNTVFTLSSEVFQVLDIADRTHPRLRSRLELARNVQDFFPLPDGVHAVQLSGDWYMGDTSLAITPLTDPDSASPLASLHVPAPGGRLFLNGHLAYVASVQEERGTKIQVVDLSDPTAPRTRGSVVLPEAVSAGYRDWNWGWGDEVVQVGGSTLAFHRYGWCGWWGGDCSRTHKVFLVDLADPDAPRVASTVELENAEWAWGLSASGSMLYLTSYRTLSRGGHTYAKYYLHRIDARDPAKASQLPAVNIPGQFLGAAESTGHVFTYDSRWDASTGRSASTVYALSLDGGRAYLRSWTALPGNPNSVQVKGSTAFASVSWSENADAAESASTSSDSPVSGSGGGWSSHNQLVTVDLSNPGAIRVAGRAELPYPWGWLQKVEAGRAFLGTGAGLFSYFVNDPAKPVFEAFFRTQGWSQDLVVQGSKLYVPSGYHGVQVIELVPVSN